MIGHIQNSAEGLIYHLFPLGFSGAGSRDGGQSPGQALRSFADWIPHLKYLGVNAVLFGPVFDSSSHGYDTKDMFRIDPRLGTNDDFAALCEELHLNGISVILDSVFNHSGRQFFAFQDLLKMREQSVYRHWYSNVDFSQHGPAGDGFSYDCWDGHSELPKFNLQNGDLREYLFKAVEFWMQNFHIDGMRMDAADVIDPYIWPLLRQFVDKHYSENIHPVIDKLGQTSFGSGRFWVLGEMVFGNYADICGPGKLDSITNYELYKGLYSSHNDGNYHELAWSLNRQFSDGGLYQGLKLYNFADNHDVNRISQVLHDGRHIYPLHLLLFTIPGLPSLYYGSETGIPGTKSATSDWDLRPRLSLDELNSRGSHPDLQEAIRRFAQIRNRMPALQTGRYRQVMADSRQFAFVRWTDEQGILVLVNSSDEAVTVQLGADVVGYNWGRPGSSVEDVLNQEWVETHASAEALVSIEIPPLWGRILQL